MKKDYKVGYMDKTDYDWELSEASGGNVIYPSIKDLKAHRECYKECGIVRVKVFFDKVIKHDTSMSKPKGVSNGKKAKGK